MASQESGGRAVLGRLLRLLYWSLFMALSLWLGGFLHFANNLPNSAAAGGQADAVVVLTGGSDRFEAGLALLAAGGGKRLLLSGVGSDADRGALRARAPDPEAAAKLDCCVDLGRRAADTRGNAREAKAWLSEHGFQSLHLVTAHYHMPRSRLLFAAAMPDVRILAHAVVPKSVIISRWWRHPGTVRLLALEYSKYLLSLIRIRVFAR